MNLELAEQKIREAVALRNAIQCEPALDMLKAVLAEFPNHPEGNYQMAWTCDAMGLEGEAVRYYEAALANRLEGLSRQRAYLGLGSTYRCLGEYEKSEKTFETATREFPENRALKVFQALTLYNLNKHTKSTELLIRQLIDTTSDVEIQNYARALRFYSEKLDEKFT